MPLSQNVGISRRCSFDRLYRRRWRHCFPWCLAHPRAQRVSAVALISTPSLRLTVSASLACLSPCALLVTTVLGFSTSKQKSHHAVSNASGSRRSDGPQWPAHTGKRCFMSPGEPSPSFVICWGALTALQAEWPFAPCSSNDNRGQQSHLCLPTAGLPGMGCDPCVGAMTHLASAVQAAQGKLRWSRARLFPLAQSSLAGSHENGDQVPALTSSTCSKCLCTSSSSLYGLFLSLRVFRSPAPSSSFLLGLPSSAPCTLISPIYSHCPMILTLGFRI